MGAGSRDDAEENHQDVREIAMKLIAGIALSPKHDQEGSIYVPPFLRYTYVPETPALMEGSILRNLTLGIDQAQPIVPSDEQVWDIAAQCGLAPEFLRTPESFNVGKNGRNLPLRERQALSIARGILSDPDVLMLHKPIELLDDKHCNMIWKALNNFCSLGGLTGMINGDHNDRNHGTTARHFLSGNSTRTVLITGDGNAVPKVVKSVVNIFFCNQELKSTNEESGPRHRGVVRKRGHLHTSYQVNF